MKIFPNGCSDSDARGRSDNNEKRKTPFHPGGVGQSPGGDARQVKGEN